MDRKNIVYRVFSLAAVFFMLSILLILTGKEQKEGSVYAAEEIIIDIESNVQFDLDALKREKKQNLPEDQLTAMPDITINMFSRNTMFLIGGTCEEDSVIHVTGGVEEIVSKSDYGDFLVEVPFAKEGVTVLKIYAEKEGKTASDVVTYIIRPQDDVYIFENKGIYGTIVGKDYQSFFNDAVPDFTGSNLFSESEMQSLEERTADKVRRLAENDCDTEIIYLMIPNPMNIYPELVPSAYVQNNFENSRTKQFKEAVTAGGAAVIDLTETMLAHKHDPFKIYHKTDSHWTEYGALLGYTDLMNHIAEKFPDAAPRPLTDFKIYNQQKLVGDIQLMITDDKPGGIGFARDDLRETTSFVDFLFTAPTGDPYIYTGNNIMIDHNVVGYQHTTKSNVEGDMPTAYIMRDSFGGPFYAFLTDRFATAFWRNWQTYDFDLAAIKNLKPDYLIYVITERNIKNVLYE